MRDASVELAFQYRLDRKAEKQLREPKLKLSEHALKTSIPSTIQIRRFVTDDALDREMIYDEGSGVDKRGIIVDTKDPTIRRLMNPHEYPVGLDIGLLELRNKMIHEARGAQLEIP